MPKYPGLDGEPMPILSWDDLDSQTVVVIHPPRDRYLRRNAIRRATISVMNWLSRIEASAEAAARGRF